MDLGDTFLMPVPGQSYPHLWIVLSDPKLNGGSFIVANLTTDACRSGTECILNVGDHPWITERSYLNLADTLEITIERKLYIDLLMGSTIRMHVKMRQAILARLLAAAKVSEALPMKYAKYF